MCFKCLQVSRDLKISGDKRFRDTTYIPYLSHLRFDLPAVKGGDELHDGGLLLYREEVDALYKILLLVFVALAHTDLKPNS